MTIVLTPYWSNGVQKLKVAPQGDPLVYIPLAIAYVYFIAPPKPPRGLTPPVHDQNVHRMRCLAQLRSKDKNIEKYIYLSQLKHADERMFYRLVLENMGVSVIMLSAIGLPLIDS